VILPQLSAQNARNSRDGFVRMLDWGLRWVFLITLPAAAGLAALAAPVMVTLFQYQEFSAHDAAMAARSLMAYAVGLPALVLVKILASGFYSRQDTRTPVRAGVVAMVVNIVLSLALMVPLQHVGLALATSLAAVINAGLLYRGLRAADAYQPLAGWRPFLLRVTFACACMTAVLLAFQPPLEQWLAWGVHQRALQLGLWVVVGLAVYPLALMLAGLRRSNLPEAVRPV
jgi:putative peptidoglycan lipid II flippase